jgi:ubiquinone/menaquinone biosynthesis C-methylase UbiE
MASTFITRGADAYDSYMGRWSQRLAPLLLDFTGIMAGEHVLDAGCGTGSLTFAIAARMKGGAIAAIDYDEGFVTALLQKNRDPRVSARKGDACNLPFSDGCFDRALSNLVLHFVSDADQAAAEMRRVLRPGGVAAASVWDIYGGMPSQRMFWDTLAAIDPSMAERRAQALFRPMTQSGELRRTFTDAGFKEVTETSLMIRMDFGNFEDYWTPLLTGQGRTSELLASLPQQSRMQVESGVRSAYLCERADGPRSFVSVARAVRGVVAAAAD